METSLPKAFVESGVMMVAVGAIFLSPAAIVIGAGLVYLGFKTPPAPKTP